MIVIAHRGASGYAPEHTLPSYDRAVELGADYLEQDLQLTRDGELVVLHDATLDRTTTGRGLVIEHTLAQVKACDAGVWFDERFRGTRVPTLREVFERYGRTARYYIETKNPADAPGMERALVALIEECGLWHDGAGPWPVIIQSFSAESLLEVRSLAPHLPLVQLIESDESSAAIRGRLAALREYAAGIGPARGSVDAELVAAAHDAGLVIHPYTVNQPDEMRRLIGLGVDGMFTDYPDRLKELLPTSSRQRMV